MSGGVATALRQRPAGREDNATRIVEAFLQRQRPETAAVAHSRVGAAELPAADGGVFRPHLRVGVQVVKGGSSSSHSVGAHGPHSTMMLRTACDPHRSFHERHDVMT